MGNDKAEAEKQAGLIHSKTVSDAANAATLRANAPINLLIAEGAKIDARRVALDAETAKGKPIGESVPLGSFLVVPELNARKMFRDPVTGAESFPDAQPLYESMAQTLGNIEPVALYTASGDAAKYIRTFRPEYKDGDPILGRGHRRVWVQSRLRDDFAKANGNERNPFDNILAIRKGDISTVSRLSLAYLGDTEGRTNADTRFEKATRAKMLRDTGMTQANVGKIMGLSPGAVQNLLNVYDLPPDVRAKIEAHDMLAHAIKFAKGDRRKELTDKLATMPAFPPETVRLLARAYDYKDSPADFVKDKKKMQGGEPNGDATAEPSRQSYDTLLATVEASPGTVVQDNKAITRDAMKELGKTMRRELKSEREKFLVSLVLDICTGDAQLTALTPTVFNPPAPVAPEAPAVAAATGADVASHPASKTRGGRRSPAHVS